jgi:hypothetical protein
MSMPGTRKARPAPSRPERAWLEMPTGRRRWATAPLSGTSSGQTGPPNTRSFRCVPVPLPVPAGSSCVSAGTSRRTAVNLAVDTGSSTQVRRQMSRQSGSGLRSRWRPSGRR